MDIERTMEFILAQQARAEAEMAAMRAKTTEYRREIHTILLQTAKVQQEQGRILVRLEKAQERTEKHLGDLAQAQRELAESQQTTEKKLQGLIDALSRGSNGYPKPR